MAPKRKREEIQTLTVGFGIPGFTDPRQLLDASEFRQMLHTARTPNDLQAAYDFGRSLGDRLVLTDIHKSRASSFVTIRAYVQALARVSCAKKNNKGGIRDQLLDLLTKRGVFGFSASCNAYLAELADTKEEVKLPIDFKLDLITADCTVGLVHLIQRRQDCNDAVMSCVTAATDTYLFNYTVCSPAEPRARAKRVSFAKAAVVSGNYSLLKRLCERFPYGMDLPFDAFKIHEPLELMAADETNESIKDLLYAYKHAVSLQYEGIRVLSRAILADELPPELVNIISDYAKRPTLVTIFHP